MESGDSPFRTDPTNECDPAASHGPLPRSLSCDALVSAGELRYYAASGTYRIEYDPDRDVPSEVVVHSVAAVAGVSPLDLDSLYSVIDPDALDNLFPASPSPRGGDTQVSFTFADHDVTVQSYGVTAVEPTVEGGS